MINLIKYSNYDEYVAGEFIKKNKASNLEIINRNNNSYIKAFDYIHNKKIREFEKKLSFIFQDRDDK
tara:strand:- start:42 stop:242 length:201 start_codon:yes stop_codon:yes gene_type:complete